MDEDIKKLDLGKAAQMIHNKQVQARQDGGPGSGKKKGQGGGRF